MIIFDGQYLSITEEDGILILALSESKENPKHYIILQKQLYSTAQDYELGLESVYIESSDLDEGGYNIIQAFEFDGKGDLMLYSDKKKNNAVICIKLKLNSDQIENLSKSMLRVFLG